MAINLSDNINYNAPKHADKRYGPWTGITHANDNVIALQRAVGLTVGILSGNTLDEYWYYSGITNSDLVLKLAGGGGVTSDHAELSNLEWEDSQHTGLPNTVPAFGPSGTTISYPISDMTGSTISTDDNSGIEVLSGDTVNTIYNTALTPVLETPNDVGGIPAGTAVSDLTGKTVVDLWNDLLFPTVQPTYTIPTITMTGVATSTLEAGSTYSPNISVYGDKNDAGIYTQLRILTGSTALFTDTTLTTGATTNIGPQFGFADPNNPNIRYTISPTPYSESFTVPLGSSLVYKADGNYNAGLAKQDNKGVYDVRTPAVRSVNAPQALSNNFSSTTYTITGIYPYFYGDSATLPTPTSIAAAIQAGTETKVLFAASGPLSIPYNVNGRYIWVAYMNTYTTKTRWYVTELDQGDTNGSFITAAVTQAVTSPDGYWSGITFKMQWSVYATIQATLEYRNT